MTEPTRELTDRRIGRIFDLYDTFDEQRRAFGVLIRAGTPQWHLMGNKSYVEWMMRHHEKIKRMGAAAASRLAEKAEEDAEFERKLLG